MIQYTDNEIFAYQLLVTKIVGLKIFIYLYFCSHHAYFISWDIIWVSII